MSWKSWIEENGVSFTSEYINQISYLFVTLKDGWIGIFEKALGQYVPCIQAADREHALTWCQLREPVTVPMERIC